MARFMNVDTDDSDIVRAIHTGKQKGMSKEAIMRVVGMPFEVIDRHYQTAPKSEKKSSAPVAEPMEAAPKMKTDEQKQAMRDRMAKARAARKTKSA